MTSELITFGTANFIAGGFAGSVAAIIGQPFDTVKTVMQVGLGRPSRKCVRGF